MVGAGAGGLGPQRVGVGRGRAFGFGGPYSPDLSGAVGGVGAPPVADLTSTDRLVLDELVDAIATHRATTDPDDDIGHDHDLRDALDAVGLDPARDPWMRVPDGFTARLSTPGVASSISEQGRAVAAYLTQAIADHRAAELTAEGLEVDELPHNDPCVVLGTVLDRLRTDATA